MREFNFGTILGGPLVARPAGPAGFAGGRFGIDALLARRSDEPLATDRLAAR